MPIDTSKIAVAAQEFMAALEGVEEYDDAKILHVGIVVEMAHPDEDGGTRAHTPTYCDEESRIYQTGLFAWALDSVELSGEPGGDIPDPEEPEHD